MPTYQYRCTACGEDLEAVQRFSDAPLTDCPVCHGLLRKVFSPVGVVFKGSGFYKTDSRSGAKPAATAKDSGSSADSTSGSGTSTDAGGGATSGSGSGSGAGSSSGSGSGAGASGSGSSGSGSGTAAPTTGGSTGGGSKVA